MDVYRDIQLCIINAAVMQNRELQIMRKLDHDNIVKLRYFFYSSGDKVITTMLTR